MSSLTGVKFILLYIAVILTLAIILTIFNPGGPF